MASTYRNAAPTIGVLAGWQFYRTATNLSYLAPIFRGIAHAARNLRCSVMLGCGMGPSASPADPLRPAWPGFSSDHDFVPVGPWNTDGLIVAVPLHSRSRSDYIREVIASGHPVLFVGSGEEGPTISANNRHGVLEAMQHLVEHGHRRIAFIAGTVEDMRGDSGERLLAYQDGLEIFNLDRSQNRVAYGRHVYDGGYLAMQQLLETGSDFSAVVASNDESALGAMRALQDAGRQIPGDVAVIGFDNRLEGSVHEPGLTSIHVPLFDIGYRAVDLLLHSIQQSVRLPNLMQVNTHLAIRESCGCSGGRKQDNVAKPGEEALNAATLARRMASAILDQAHGITEEEGLKLCQRLVDTFAACIRTGDSAVFRETLAEVLDHTEAQDDDSHIWQDAISLMSDGFGSMAATDPSSALRVRDFLSEARLRISAQMRRQHRQYVVDERRISSRLSLLTARLLTALDETEIFAILASHLPHMDVHTALVGLFEAGNDGPGAWMVGLDLLNPQRARVRFQRQEFPPPSLITPDEPFILTLIPLSDQSGQIGIMVFDAQHVDLYGSVVQQVGGALNTARLYRDATEGRRLAEEANQMKDRFLSTISHELRTPLNLIVGLSEMVLRDSDESDLTLPDALLKDIERIHAYSQHLGGLIGDVIDLATSSAGQLRLNNEYVDLGRALRIIAETGSQMAADKGLAWETNLSETGPWVWGDATRLRQVALNLISNAIKFTSQGSISFRVDSDDQVVTVSVRDTGMGISLNEQQVIFDEFQQSNRSVARGYGGLGLGLAISKRLVEMHGGSITVHSTGEDGAGSTFSFALPTARRPAEPTPGDRESLPTKPCIVLLNSHNSTSGELYALLQKLSYDVRTVIVEAGTDWRSDVVRQHPDAVIVDVSVDTAFGWNTLKELKGVHKLAGVPVFFFGAASSDGALLELDYITKPIEISELTRALDNQWLLPDTERRHRTVLVVDDEPSTLEMHARIVQSHASSNRVLKARNGREALDILHHEVVDLILLDLQMPEMDGFQVLEAMRQMESVSGIPVIVVTGKVLTEHDMSRLNEGIAAVLGKGLFSIEETISHITSALEHKRKLSEESRRLIRMAMGYIHQNFAESLSRGDIARHVGISEDHLTFCFRKELGTTPVTYLQRYRINQAKNLLRDSQQTISDIAQNVGFSDSSYFSRIFHRETGISPDSFRRL
ncbi:MAG: substrate-binding domain-containing protein [Anaerolineae bacterium]|nr:substrate-binding domain-containing protein [Anaerolineae bacterium]